MKRRTTARFSLLLFMLVSTLACLLIAWVSIRQKLNPKTFVGFPENGPRQIAFVEAGQLHHTVTHTAVDEGSGKRVCVTLSIELNHDRVMAFSIENCLTAFENTNTSLHESLKAGDPSQVERYANLLLTIQNGTSAVKSVKVTDFKFLPPDTKAASTTDERPDGSE